MKKLVFRKAGATAKSRSESGATQHEENGNKDDDSETDKSESESDDEDRDIWLAQPTTLAVDDDINYDSQILQDMLSDEERVTIKDTSAQQKQQEMFCTRQDTVGGDHWDW